MSKVLTGLNHLVARPHRCHAQKPFPMVQIKRGWGEMLVNKDP